jgi:hypothetical protein
VLSAERAATGWTVLVEPAGREGACPECGVLSSRIRACPVQRVRDVECGGAPLEVLVPEAAAGVLGTGVSAPDVRGDHR